MHIRVTSSPSQRCSVEWTEIWVHQRVTDSLLMDITSLQLPNLPLACKEDTVGSETNKVLLLFLS